MVNHKLIVTEQWTKLKIFSTLDLYRIHFRYTLEETIRHPMPPLAWSVMIEVQATIIQSFPVRVVRDSSSVVSRRTWCTPAKMMATVSSTSSPETTVSIAASSSAHRWEWREKVCWGSIFREYLKLALLPIYKRKLPLWSLAFTPESN